MPSASWPCAPFSIVLSLVAVSHMHMRAGESGRRQCEVVEDDEGKSRRNGGVGPVNPRR